MDEHATALADAIEAALPGWVERSVLTRLTEAGLKADSALLDTLGDTGRRAASEVGEAVRALLALDIDEQWTTPLSLVRGAVRYPTAILREAGVPPVERDRLQAELHPEDVYDLAPASFADVDPTVAEPGMVWGASKAYAHIRRHAGPEGPERGGPAWPERNGGARSE